MSGISTKIVVPVEYKATVDNSAVDTKFSQQTEQYPLANATDTSQNTENLQILGETVNSNTESFKDNTAIIKEFGDLMPEIIKNLRYMNTAVAQTTKELPAIGRIKNSEEKKKEQLALYERQGIMGLINQGNNTLGYLAGGNIGGAGINMIQGFGNALNGASKMAELKESGELAKGLMAGGGVALAVAGLVAAGKKLADTYEKAMPTIYGTGKAFGTVNDSESMLYYQQANKYNRGTGLDNHEFNSIVQDLRKQGVASQLANDPLRQVETTAQIAEITSRWAYRTGGDASQYANLAGLMSRYGGSKGNEIEDFNKIIAAGYNSGLEDTQIPEFLSGIQKVMEDGIAKGFVRSSTEVADTLLMFSKMSGGNPLWQSDQGAKLLMQANSGLAGATSLSSTEHILAYAAIRNAYSKNDEAAQKMKDTLSAQGSYVEGAEYVNYMQMLERGITPDNIGDLMAYVNGHYIDKDSKIEAYKNMFGLNYQGAAKFYDLTLGISNGTLTDEEEIKKKIKSITEGSENKNNETRWKEDLNKISLALESAGEGMFNIELSSLDTTAKFTELIYEWLKKDEDEVNYGNNVVKSHEIKNDLSKEQQEKIEQLKPYDVFLSESDAAAIVNGGLTEWVEGNYLGYIPGLNNDERIYQDYNKGKLKKKGSKFNLEELEAYYRYTYGDYIRDKIFNGDSEAASEFISQLAEYSMNPNSEEARSMANRVYKETSDEKVTKDEKSKTEEYLRKICNALLDKNGKIVFNIEG